jgi:hypothetical protein
MNKNLQVREHIIFDDRATDSLQEVNIQNMNVELVAQMFKNYQSSVLSHLEGELKS